MSHMRPGEGDAIRSPFELGMRDTIGASDGCDDRPVHASRAWDIDASIVESTVRSVGRRSALRVRAREYQPRWRVVDGTDLGGPDRQWSRFAARQRACGQGGPRRRSDWAEDVAAVAPAWRREVVAVIDPGLDRARPTGPR